MRQQNQVFQVNKQTNTDTQFDRKFKKKFKPKKEINRTFFERNIVIFFGKCPKKGKQPFLELLINGNMSIVRS